MDSELGKLIKDLRKEKRMTLKEVSENGFINKFFIKSRAFSLFHNFTLLKKNI